MTPTQDKTTLTPFLLIYGSQTGQAKAIGEDVAEKAPEHGFTADVRCISESDKSFWLEKEHHVVIITSTTGDGDPPETAQKFFRRLKKKTLPSNHLENLRYSILGLGDTNYSNFCNCGKNVNKRLQELGATPFMAPAWADDGTGLEIVVEPWIESLWVSLTAELKDQSGDLISGVKSENPSLQNVTADNLDKDQSGQISATVTGEKLETIVNGVCSDEVDAGNGSVPENTNHNIQKLVSGVNDLTLGESAEGDSPNVQPKEGVTDTVQSDEGATGNKTPDAEKEDCSKQEETLTSSVPPLMESGLTLPALPAAYIKLDFLEERSFENYHPELQNNCPFPSAKSDVLQATVTSAIQLTRDDAVKKTLLFSLDIGESGWNWCPGDSVGILAPNPEIEVYEILDRLGLHSKAQTPYKLNIIPGTKKRNAAVPAHIPPIGTLYDVLRYSCDIRSPPKKALLRAFVEYTTNSGEKRRLQELCSRQGGESYSKFVREAGVGVMDILTAFPSCQPPVTLLLEHLPRLQPRPYSAASSNLVNTDKLDIVFNVIDIPSGNGRHRSKLGVCTGYLDNLTSCIQKKRNPDNSSEDGNFHEREEQLTEGKLLSVGVYLRSNQYFRPSEDLSRPTIMIGPGTGVAPFIGFLQHREKQIQSAGAPGLIGDSWLFFGCRHRDRDFIFRKEMEAFVDAGVLGHLHVCHSRDSEIDDGLRYVQQVLLSEALVLAPVICEGEALIYVCGDAKGMARDVAQALRTIIREYKGLDEAGAEAYLKELRNSRRYLEDVWS